jgi:hypothetical protein
MAQYQCVQFGICTRADKGECFDTKGEFKCGREPEDPDCQSKLEPVSGGQKSGLGLKLGLLLVIVVVLLAMVGMYLFKTPSMPQPPASEATAAELLKEVWPWLP